MTERTVLYKECPLCNQSEVAWAEAISAYRCGRCGLSLKDGSFLKFFNKGRYKVADFGRGNYTLAQDLLKVRLPADPLKVAIGNVYTDEQIAQIAGGNLEHLRPVRTVLAQIILEQLNEACFLQIVGLRRGRGQPLPEAAAYRPTGAIPKQGMVWQDGGNLFCTTSHLVFPSDRFTFIRLDRKLVAVKAFSDGLAMQRKGEDYATYFAGCQPHEAALAAAYVLAKVPLLQQKLEQVSG